MMMMLRPIFILLVLIGAVAVHTPTADAQFATTAKREASVDAAKDMLAWMQNSGAIVQSLTQLFSDDLLGALLLPTQSETIDVDNMQAAIETYSAAREQILEDAQAQIDALPAPERWNFDLSLFSKQERGIYKATQLQYNDLQTTHKIFADISGEFVTMFERSLEGETIDEKALLGRISESSNRVILSENRSLEAFISAMPNTSPNKEFHQIMLALNNVAVVETDMLADYVAGESPISLRQTYGRKMKTAMKKVPQYLRTGRRKIGPEIATYKAMLKNSRLSEQEKEFIANIAKASEMFTDSFDTEQAIYAKDLANANLYASDKSDDDIEAEVEANEAEYFTMIQQRMNIMNARMAAVQ